MEVTKNETTEDREGRDGRIRTSRQTEWVVSSGGEFIASFKTRKEAVGYVERTGNIVTTSIGDEAAAKARRKANRAAKDDLMRSLGLIKVKGAVSGKTYWE
jgi:hypothetical protein